MKELDLNLLKTLIAVAESKNFYEAAGKLHLSQPAVSLHLKELESQAPLPLFQLEGKRKVLTHYGRSLYQVAVYQLKELERNLEGLERLYASPERLTLRIGGRTEILEYIAPYLDFAGRVELKSFSSAEAVEKLLSHELDIAISHVQPNSTEVVAKKLFQSATHFVVHEKILGRKKLSLDLAKDEEFLTETPCLFYQSEGHVLREWLQQLAVPFEKLKVRYVTDDWRSLQNLVDRGFGYALVPEYIKSHSARVCRLELPAQMMPRYQYHALFEKGLKRIEPFKRVLDFDSLKKAPQAFQFEKL